MKKKLTLTALCAFSAITLISCGGKKTETEGEASGTPAAASTEVQAGSLPSHSGGTPGGVKLETELPPELIEGTPPPISVPHLEPAASKAPEFLVPEGTVLLSKGKTVTSSDDAPIIGDLTLVTDGDKQAGEGYFVELLEGLQWVQIDLEKESTLSAIWLWHFHSQQRAYHDVIIQVSNDPEFKEGVTTVFNNDYDDSAKLGKGGNKPYIETRYGLLVDAKNSKGRYVRLYSNGNTSNAMNHYIEVEVYGE